MTTLAHTIARILGKPEAGVSPQQSVPAQSQAKVAETTSGPRVPESQLTAATHVAVNLNEPAPSPPPEVSRAGTEVATRINPIDGAEMIWILGW